MCFACGCKQNKCYHYTGGILHFAFVLKDSVTSRWCEGALLVFRSKTAVTARGNIHLLTSDDSVPQRVLTKCSACLSNQNACCHER